MGPYLSIDETALSKGELYTIITNKEAKGKKGSIVGIFSGTKVEPIIKQLMQVDRTLRLGVKEITLDMAHSMKQIAEKCFPKATQVTDRFHVQRLALDALQDLRIKHRWEALDQENEAIKNTRKLKKEYKPELLANGDTRKQLLARSRYLLYKAPKKWTPNQKQRAQILFAEYPDLKNAFEIVHELRSLYNSSRSKNTAYTKLAHWYLKVEQSGFKAFQTIVNTISANYRSILNYFERRSTNASAESFNAKIKAFRAQFRGVKKVEFFLFRLTQIFA